MVGRDGDPLKRAFAPLIGLPAWNVQKGHGSSLTLEFGEPHLKVREPIVASPGVSEPVRAILARRRVFPRGEWHLWIWCCHWRVFANGAQIGWSDAPDQEIEAAAREIEGQVLTSVEADATRATSSFCFDQGAALRTWPYEDRSDYEQWMLFMKSGDVFTYRADGRYSLGPGNQTDEETTWLPLPPGH